ncbi:MAG: CrcB family protein [Chitinophagaceae bacterium]|nr:CrcB family protein [Chitinophagaceae bacterium]
MFLTVGFCGAFSTFSTFSSETLTLFQQGHNTSLVLYILGSILLCVTATFGGLFAGDKKVLVHRHVVKPNCRGYRTSQRKRNCGR